MKKTWPVVKFGEFLRRVERFENRDDFKEYHFAGTYSFARGIFVGAIKSGSSFSLPKVQRIKEGDFVYCKIMAWEGAFGIVPGNADDCVLSGAFVVYEVDRSQIEPRFLEYFFKFAPNWISIGSQSTGTNVRRRSLHPRQFENSEITLPPLAEQRRIVARIEQLSAKIEEARTLHSQAVEGISALLTTARRTIIAECPADTVALEDACEAIIDNLHSNPRLSEEGIACVRSPDVGYGTLNLTNAQRTNEEEFRRRTVRGEPRANDIVLVREGGGTGKCAVVESGQKFSLGQRVMMLRPNVQRILPRFFLHQLLSPLLQEDQIAPLSKGSASPHLNIGALKRFDLRLPPLPEQRCIVAYLDDLQAKVDAVKKLQEESEAELNALMPSIISRAFAGEL